MTYDGHVSIVQPQIMPLFDSKSVIQVLSPIVYSKEQSAYDTVKNVWKSNIIKSGNFEREWDKVLHDGLYKKPILKKVNVRPASKISTAVLNNYILDNDKF